ncbi:TPA: tetratricopeptide repeat protein [Candidatus Galligastranaerophilus faecipullorum]|nr:tetratricopeptide repeat protein [Candidatus Galligastranaerophilus faecipullorum]
MDTSDLQFSIEIIDKIKNFYNSTSELLLLCGFSGCAKSEILNKTLEDLDDNTLVFKHLCFEHTAIDDFLLNFYDSFRKFSLEKKVSLKKTMGESFANKVSFYFKDIDKKCIIVVDNYELVSDNIEILNLLAHIASFKNTKVVLVSRDKQVQFFINQNLAVQIIEITPNDFETFKAKIQNEGLSANEDTLEEFFKLSGGYELYLKMVTRYSKTTGISIGDLISEFNKKSVEFSDFIILKVASLVPGAYLEFLKNLSGLNHAVSIDFIKNYNLGDIRQIDYLERNLLISKIDNDIILRNYFKPYFQNMLSVQEKYRIFTRFVEIYEEELAKSPRDRLLRLSRESIRKQIEMLKQNIPRLGSGGMRINQDNFSYISLAQEGANPWFDKKTIDKKQKYLDKKRELQNKKPAAKKDFISEEDALILKEYRRKKLLERQEYQESISEENDFMLEFKKADEYEQTYRYAQAVEILLKLKNKAPDDETKIEILKHLARNSEKLNRFEDALEYYTQTGSLHLIRQDYEKYFKTLLDIAVLYKNLYRFESAKEEYFKIVNTEKPVQKSVVTAAYTGLGDIFESENSISEALKYYRLASDFSDPSDIAANAEITYKTAILYDDMQDFDNAIEFYLKNIQTSTDTTLNKWLSQCYVNLGLIYSYKNDNENAVKYIKLALEKDREDNNPAGVYFASRELSKIYETENLEKAIEYLREALECAKTLHDEFKEAFAYLELGDLYYNFNQDELALECFFEAKKALGENILDENEQIINQRINDMKIKMLPVEFQRIEVNYAQ